MAETAPGEVATSASHLSAPQWQTFEMRMRTRRAVRLTLRAKAALEQGMIAEAEAALEEARTLDSSTPDLETLRVQIALSQEPATMPPESAPTVEPATAVPHSRRFAAPVAVAASLLLITMVAVWNRNSSVPQPSPPASPGSERAAVAPPAPIVLPAITETTTPPARSIELQAAEAPDPAPLPVSPLREAEVSPPLRSVAAPVGPVIPLREQPVSEPPVRDGIDGAPAIAEPLPAPPPVAATQPEPEPVDEMPLVRRVLSQYEVAYSSLDASAAKRVWPGLDSRARSRAFDGLQSQRVSLGQCDVSVTGAGARADCHGSADWTPKVGGGSRSEARSWSFDLRKGDSGEWRIVDAIVR